MRRWLATSCLVLVSTAALAQTTNRPGLYESTVTMNMPGGQPPRTNTTSHCVTPEEASDPGGNLARSMQQNRQCAMSNKTMANGHFTADMVCTGEANSTTHMDFTFTDTSVQGTMAVVMKMPQMPQPMTMNMTIRSVRKGDCVP